MQEWSCPAMEIGGLLVSLHPSHDFSFLQEIKIIIPINKIPVVVFNTGFMFTRFNIHKLIPTPIVKEQLLPNLKQMTRVNSFAFRTKRNQDRD